MDLFQEIRELEAAAEQYAEDDQNVSQWLSELLEIKKSRIALEVFMVDGKPEVVLYTCLECGSKEPGSDETPAAYNIPGVTDGPMCICRTCWDKDPERYGQEFDNLMGQMMSGEFDGGEGTEPVITCARCGSKEVEDRHGVMFCGGCGAQFTRRVP